MKATLLPTLAFESAHAIRQRQAGLLRKQIRYCRQHSPFYGRLMAGHKLPIHAPMPDLLAALPLTGKDDLERANDAFLAVAPQAIVDIVMSSGTTGKPTRIAYTENDLQRLAYNEERALIGCGLTSDDIVLLTCTLDRCFIAGLAYFLGVRRLGAAAIRNGHDTMEGHAETIRRVRPTALIGVPSFILKLGECLKANGIDPADTPVRCVMAIGEPVRDRAMQLLRSGQAIESLWNARIYSTYASSEIVTSFCECRAQNGGHLHPDLAIVEIIDAGGQPAAPGTVGEVVVTPLGVEGMPLLRFRTGDLSFLMETPCPCGRNTVRLGPILGRRKQMLKVRGTTLYPPAILSALSEIDAISEFYVSVASDAALCDQVTVHVAIKQNAVISADAIARRLQARLRVKPAVLIEEQSAVRRIVHTPSSRKPIRFIDHRG